MLSRLIKVGMMIILSMALVLGTVCIGFAESSNKTENVKINANQLKTVKYTKLNLKKLNINTQTLKNQNYKPMNFKVGDPYNRIYIRENIALPLVKDETTGDLLAVTDTNYWLYETYSGYHSMMWMDVTKLKQDRIKQELQKFGKTLSGWYIYTAFDVDVKAGTSALLVWSINGKESRKSVTKGNESIKYMVNLDENAIWSGYLQYFVNGGGTSGCNGGLNFGK